MFFVRVNGAEVGRFPFYIKAGILVQPNQQQHKPDALQKRQQIRLTGTLEVCPDLAQLAYNIGHDLQLPSIGG